MTNEDTPQFTRMIDCLVMARTHWGQGDREHARRLLRLVGSIAIAEAHEPGPHDPVPEATSRPPEARAAAPEAGVVDRGQEIPDLVDAALDIWCGDIRWRDEESSAWVSDLRARMRRVITSPVLLATSAAHSGTGKVG